MRIFDKLAVRIHKKLFNQAARRVLQTPPVQMDKSSGLAVLSQTYDADIYLYLVAAKTFAKYIHPEIFIVVDDSLSASNKELIVKHLVNVRFLPRKRVPNAYCPSGGTWERILSIADASKDYYVVQLDSDTVTVRNPEMVLEALARNISFTLSTHMGRHFISAEQARTQALTFESQHVQVLAERALYSVPELSDKQYIRGCSGFAGFARGSLSREAVEHFSRLMAAQLGQACWASWGTEQFTSNYFVANTASAQPLPFEQYPYWAPQMDLDQARLVHFIGDNRFTSSQYAQVATKAIHML
ncbi:hypothetical protein [Simplicispira psychrophila]|uniref:hypothetical protein n=1 Tax=Simplicispira psychrophila TaxID=80882 RepID=UPI0004827CDA|nr:hypothetical protein [Simplicispira psychrophila]